MAFYDKATEFAGLAVVEYQPAIGLVLPPSGDPIRAGLLQALRADPDDTASRNAFLDYMSERGERLASAYRGEEAYDWDAEAESENLEAFLAEPAACLVEALVLGNCWDIADGIAGTEWLVERLVGLRERLPRLRALFLGDIVRDENELSWIHLSELTRLFAGFPRLEHFRSRGEGSLVLPGIRHARLESLVMEAAELPPEVIRGIGGSDLPALNHLELWLGTSRYGDAKTTSDLKGILDGAGMPSLRHLGLRNSDLADNIAVALRGAPILERLRVLDLSLGNLSDEGAQALLDNPAVAKLEKLDIHHHYVSSGMVARLRGLGIEVDASDPRTARDEDDRYVAHSE